MKLKIRDMKKSDVPYVCDIQMAAFGERTPEDFDHCIDSKLYWYGVIESGTTIVGYFGTMFVENECELLIIAIDELYRNMGIGTYALSGIVLGAKQKGAKAMFLEVNENNPAAIHLYEKLGFVRQYVRKGYYKNKNGKPSENAIVMRLELK